MDRIIVFSLAVIAINIAVFLLVPAGDISLSFADFRPQALFLFQFMHFNATHLIENVAGLLLVALIAAELEMKFESFLVSYFVGVFIAVPMLAFFPDAIIAGNSTGIYSVLAAALVKARNFVPQKISLPLFAMFIFSLSIANFFMCGPCVNRLLKTDMFHFSGFASGIASRYRRTGAKRLLRCD
ncbi:MAG: rhomboid family intramembrane serine protease [Candidatus Aenigmatarchaeota archaeon]